MSIASVVHIQTTVQTIFGILDSDGDVVDKRTVNAAIRKLTAKDFDQLLKTLQVERGKLEAEMSEIDTRIE